MPFVDPAISTSIDLVETAFADRYGYASELVTRAPGRVNLMGEHTDYNGGPCLPVALSHATYAAVAPRDDAMVRLASTNTTTTWDGPLGDLGPGTRGWAAYAGGVAWALRQVGIDVPGFDLVVTSTVPVGAGLSSSAALECSVATAIGSLAGLELTDELREVLVRASMRAESEVAGAPTGGMDQTIAMRATAGSALLLDFADGSVTPVALRLDDADVALLVTDTRVSHALSDGGYGDRRSECEAAAAALRVPTLGAASLPAVEGLRDDVMRRRARHIVTEVARVADTVAAIEASDWSRVGRAMLESHRSMRDDFEISSPELDLAVSAACDAGALGARMTGGGFGGSSVAAVAAGEVEPVAASIEDAFLRAGLAAPGHLVVTAAGAACEVARSGRRAPSSTG